MASVSDILSKLFQLLSPPAQRFRSSFCGHLPQTSFPGASHSNFRHQLGCKSLPAPFTNLFQLLWPPDPASVARVSDILSKLFQLLSPPAKRFRSSFCGHLPQTSFPGASHSNFRHQLGCKCLPAPFTNLFQLLWPPDPAPSTSDILSKLFQLLSPSAKRFRSSFCGHLPQTSFPGASHSNFRHQLGCKCLPAPFKDLF